MMASSLGAWAQEDNPPPIEVKGFVDTYQAFRSTSPFNFMSSRSTVRTEIKKRFGTSQVNVSLNLVHNALFKEGNILHLREAYFEHREKNWSLSAGRQLIIWGVADGIRITDHISPMDLTEFLAQDYDDIRMPVNALRLMVFNDKVQFEAVVVPTFEGHKLPSDERNPWYPFSQLHQIPGIAVTWDHSVGKPAMKINNIEYGGRLNFTLPGIDFSISALHTWNKMPVIEQQWINPKEVKVIPRHYRMGFVGGNVSIPIGQLVLRGEAAWNIDKHFTYKSTEAQRGFNSLNWLLGLDWYAPNEWMISGQFSSENIFDYKPYINQERNTSLLTLNISKNLLGNTLRLSDFVYYDIISQGWFSRFTADYALSDQIHLLAGYDWIGSKKGGIFTSYKNNSEFWFRFRYSF
ncbi:DUF1302 family protein [Porphyromonas sp.]|uniref:DUF1302 family protein n=1 Tax=Porphyromonas sp. TaxID=1924944 RepID=UPI0026DDBF73|nr:DUF1302 family protein [Porphyromonas sp.]MDO4695435.1 hypothetical protein [Porphyromonas sp.]MDO4771250.1 hypothetical protein [Porphyromonas sp.]